MASETFTKSDYLKQLQALLQQGAAAAPYESPWQARLDETMEKILNREPFAYDLGSDALYRMYRDQYTQLGRQAMQDTMGVAAAMTGGYSNSYAQSAGQQAYQGYLQQLGEQIPALYQLALQTYQQQGDSLRENLSLLQQQENQDYQRYRDAASDYQSLYNRYADTRDHEYRAWADSRDFTYQQQRDEIEDEQWQKEFNEAVRQFNAKLWG